MSNFLIVTKESGTISAHGNVKEVVFKVDHDVGSFDDVKRIVSQKRFNEAEARCAIEDLINDGKSSITAYDRGVLLTITFVKFG